MVKRTNVTARKLLKVVGIFLCIVLVIDLTPLGGNIPMYINAIRCGHLPLQDEVMYTGQIPHYGQAPTFDILRGYGKYYCTPEEAERAGLSADERYYSFPHLPKNEFQQSVEKSKKFYQ